MNTRRRITQLLGAVALSVAVAALVVIVVLGPALGAFVLLVVGSSGWALYTRIVGPWHRTWGATPREVQAPLPGDELVPEAATTTRAITIDAPSERVWPWLVQIGFGRAGWYSYDWIDNDGRPSADGVVGDLQGLAVGDRIPMTPELGFVVVALDPPRALVARSDDGSTSWCLHLETVPGDRCRLVSRFRTHAEATLGALAWTAIADPGAFMMERRMLKGIRRRCGQHVVEAERSDRSWPGRRSRSGT